MLLSDIKTVFQLLDTSECRGVVRSPGPYATKGCLERYADTGRKGGGNNY